MWVKPRKIVIDKGHRGDLYFSVAVVARLGLSREVETAATSGRRDAGRKGVGSRRAESFETQPTRAHHARAWAAKPRGSELRPGRVAEGENHLSRNGVTPALRAQQTRGGIFLPSELFNVSARFSLNTLLRRARRSPTLPSRLDETAPRKMNSEMNTNTPPSRTTHARVLRARARLRRLHRRRQLNPSRNG
jgi:hypothetical protein